MIAKLSGIGCSSKTPTYFVSGAHGFNSAHGRMPAIATGANAANRELTYIGISGDGDSLSIGLGQLCHAIRRNVQHALRHREQRRLRPDQGPVLRLGRCRLEEQEAARPTDGARSIRCCSALSLGATFVARSFSGDKEQLVPILKAGLAHRGFALVDVISPCVTFNDHDGSTKSYLHTRKHTLRATQADFVPPAPRDHRRLSSRGRRRNVTMHDGSSGAPAQGRAGLRPDRPRPRLRPYPRAPGRRRGLTGLLYLAGRLARHARPDDTVDEPADPAAVRELCPGNAELEELQKRLGSSSPEACPIRAAPERAQRAGSSPKAHCRWEMRLRRVGGDLRFCGGHVGAVPSPPRAPKAP